MNTRVVSPTIPSTADTSLEPKLDRYEKDIKPKYKHLLKWYHNSIHNPKYPKLKVNKCEDDKCKVITIIGNMVTKAFFDCVQWAEILYKCRRRIYGRPVIKGVTALEWKIISSDLRLQYPSAYCANNEVAVLIDKKYIGCDIEFLRYCNRRYYYYSPIRYRENGVKEFLNYVRDSGRLFVYFRIWIEKKYIGPLVFMLYTDLVPKTCMNFVKNCVKRVGGYTGTQIHRIVKDGFLQCGGFLLTKSSMYCENYIVEHDRRGVLSMANSERHLDNTTQFIIDLQPMAWMNTKYVAFGQLVYGDYVLRAIEEVPTRHEEPQMNILITESGIIRDETTLNAVQLQPLNTFTEFLTSHFEDSNEFGSMLYYEILENVNIEIEIMYLYTEYGESEETYEVIDKLKARRNSPKRIPSTKHTVSPTPGQSVMTFISDLIDGRLKQLLDEMEKVPRSYYHTFGTVECDFDKESLFDVEELEEGCYTIECDGNIMEKMYDFVFDEEKIYYERPVDLDEESLDSDIETQLKEYIDQHKDHVSFAGPVIISISETNKKLRNTRNIANETKRAYPKQQQIVSKTITPPFRDMRISNQEMDNINLNSAIGKLILRACKSSEGEPMLKHTRLGERKTKLFLAPPSKTFKHTIHDEWLEEKAAMRLTSFMRPISMQDLRSTDEMRKDRRVSVRSGFSLRMSADFNKKHGPKLQRLTIHSLETWKTRELLTCAEYKKHQKTQKKSTSPATHSAPVKMTCNETEKLLAKCSESFLVLPIPASLHFFKNRYF